jgi:hypothetical protein
MDKYKIFIIENKPNLVQGIIDAEYSTEDYEVSVLPPETDFDAGMQRLQNEAFDVLVLDLKKDPGEEYPGNNIFSNIWRGINSFLPVLVFSSYHQNLEINEHPLITKFDKSEELALINHLKNNILPKMKRIRELRKEINLLAREGLRIVDLNESLEVQKHRMANYIKHYLENKEGINLLPPDIQYILLPEYSGLCSGDIIQRIPDAEKGIGDDELCMIVTPSCEMHSRNNRGELRYKKDVLCKKIINKPGHVQIDDDKKIFNNGHDGNGYIFLPKLTIQVGEVSLQKNNKVVECKSSLLLDQEKISLNNKETNLDKFEWRKIAAISSPYRERIISACYNNRSRIGVPNLDKDGWWD